MKAAVYTKYGPAEVIRIADVDTPVPKSNQILIKIHVTTVNRTDCGFRSAQYFITRFITGLAKPKKQILGCEFAGEVVAVGSEVTDFKVGDRVFGFDDADFGGHAEYKVIAANKAIALVPKKMKYEDVGPGTEGAMYALSYLQSVKVGKGSKILVHGATGAIGSAGVQLAKSMGAEVTATCRGKHMGIVKKLGAGKVIDYEKHDFTKIDDTFDLVFDSVGKSSYKRVKRLLKPSGIYCSSELGPYCQNPMLALWFGLTRSRRVIFPIPKGYKEKVELLAELHKTGKFKPLIDRTYQLKDIVKASEYVESGQKVGNVVIKIK